MRFEVFRLGEEWQWCLFWNERLVAVSSELYRGEDDCLRGIEQVREAALSASVSRIEELATERAATEAAA